MPTHHTTPNLDSLDALQQLTQWLQLKQTNENGDEVLVSPSLWQLLTLLMLLARLLDRKTGQPDLLLDQARQLTQEACRRLEVSETEAQALLKQADAQGPLLAEQLAAEDIPLENCQAWHASVLRSVEQVLASV